MTDVEAREILDILDLIDDTHCTSDVGILKDSIRRIVLRSVPKAMDAVDIKRLSDETGAGIYVARHALSIVHGDYSAAKEYLRKIGW